MVNKNKTENTNDVNDIHSTNNSNMPILPPEIVSLENKDWTDSLKDVFYTRGSKRISDLLSHLQIMAQKLGVVLPTTSRTPRVNTISVDRQPNYPGNRAIERKIKNAVRWNAMAMVVEANKHSDGIGGHISTFASAATLYEVGFQHFFKGENHPDGSDLIYFQGHASPGIYARAFLEGRLTKDQLKNFRREINGDGLSSYPHPWLMPDFWQFPTVSMGLGPLMAAYQARFLRYLTDRDLGDHSKRKIWAFLGDGEQDEPESLAAIQVGAREKLDNLIFVINCNLQRLDGPVRGNSGIMQELESHYRGAGWNVIKLIWGSEWDEILANDTQGLLVQRLGEIVDGEFQKAVVEGGAYIRKLFFGTDPRLLKMVDHLSDDELWDMSLGGHDAAKVHAAYQAAVSHTGQPTVILARTIKGYGLGEAGEGRNVTHQQKKLNEKELLEFRDRFDVPLSDEEASNSPLYTFSKTSPEQKYLIEHRDKLGGFLPSRNPIFNDLEQFDVKLFDEFYEGSADRVASTTMVFVRILSKLMRDENIGKRIVPIVPDEARTFGMEAFFRQFGIYSHVGQLYDPVDKASLLYYKESTDGQILEEGITESGSMSSFIAAATSYANNSLTMIPFYIYYSMFGFARTGDLAWAAADSRSRGFLIGGTAGRTTLNGEGLQHQDGHGHLLFSVVPQVKAYDPAYAYEIAIIVREGLQRMFYDNYEEYYYIAVGNENYTQPTMPSSNKKLDEHVLKGMYLFNERNIKNTSTHVALLGSGAIHKEVVKAQKLLEKYDVSSEVWSVTSYTELRREALEIERWNILNPTKKQKKSHIANVIDSNVDLVVASSDYLKSLPDLIAKWLPVDLLSLGTDGFGRSDTREELRNHFEVDARWIVVTALSGLLTKGKVDESVYLEAIDDLEIDISKVNPVIA
jgi:pyruvate dehydrogenase E1 component